MRKAMMVMGLLSFIFGVKAQISNFEDYPVYTGNDLGANYSKASTTFKVWSPVADSAEVIIYVQKKRGIFEMEKSGNGTWERKIIGDQKGNRYTYRVKIKGKWSEEVTDPYAKAVEINGRKGKIIDLKETNPPGWNRDKIPAIIDPTASIIYELHIRDASISPNSGIKHKGKFPGLTERGTKNTAGHSTGIDHIVELGVTHVHLLPIYDFNSIDETLDKPPYNWGYDPLNYNVPEGSYATNSDARIFEFKQLVKTFHDRGLNVVMDVVYNHTALREKSNFNQLVPGYYYRQNADGKFSDATACGNETASERPMFRKFMFESMKYWVDEYHIDGFRVDLMGVHDIETMNLISRELNKIRPGILIYGEGWTAGASPLPESQRALKANVSKLERIAVFSDDMRDGLKGSVFKHDDRGFVSNKPGMEESVKFGIVASGKHPQVDYSKVNYSKSAYTTQPSQVINYAECHDNNVLWDKLALSATTASDAERKDMYKLALVAVLTSQGIPFLHAGTEFYRTKKGVENSYKSPDSINAINWDWKTQNLELVQFVQSLVKLRKDHPAFRMKSADEIQQHLRFLEGLPAGVIGYTIDGKATGDTWAHVMVILNGTGESQIINWTGNKMHVFEPGRGEGMKTISPGAKIPPYSFIICHE